MHCKVTIPNLAFCIWVLMFQSSAYVVWLTMWFISQCPIVDYDENWKLRLKTGEDWLSSRLFYCFSFLCKLYELGFGILKFLWTTVGSWPQKKFWSRMWRVERGICSLDFANKGQLSAYNLLQKKHVMIFGTGSSTILRSSTTFQGSLYP